MTTKDSLRFVIAATLLLWLGLMFAPALLADEAWQEIEHPSLDVLYASSKQPVTSYAAAKLDTVSVWFPGGDEQAGRRAGDLRRMTSNHFEAAIAARGMALAGDDSDSSAVDLVIVRIQLIDLRSLPGDGIAPEWARNFRFRVAPGRVTLVAELVDAATGQTVLRMADLQDAVSIDTPASVDRVLRHWGGIVAQSAVTLPGTPKLARAH